MQLLCTGEKIKIVWNGQRISFARIDEQRATEEDLEEAEKTLELFNQRQGGTC